MPSVRKTPRGDQVAASLSQVRVLLDFVEDYGAQHPDFALALSAALAGRPPAPAQRKPAEPTVGLLELYGQAAPQGEAALGAHLAGLSDAELVKAGRSVGLRITKKEGRAAAEARILNKVKVESARGSAFLKP